MTTIENRPATDVNESIDPRDPLLRLATFFDDGSVELLHERDKSGVLAAAGTVNGVRTIAFCTDGTVMGGAMGVDGCKHIVDAYDVAIDEQSPIVGIWHSGGARLASTMQDCDLFLMANTGHWAQWERAEQFNALAAAHLGDER